MARLIHLVERAALAVAAAALLVVTAAMVAQVVFRYGLRAPLQWSETLSVYALVWLVFIGAGALAFRDGHVSIASVTDLLPTPLRALVQVLGRAATLALVGVVLWISWFWLTRGAHQMSPALGLSTRWVKLALPIGFGLLGLAAALRLAEDLAALARRDWARFAPSHRDDG